tara:strand:- start:664 stop:1914 length:1251 start_codon:yes stop_codon:yes gene_type:complete
MLISFAIIALLFSAFFNGVEIAFISANKLQLELDKEKGRFTSKMISFFSKNESDFIATIVIVNNIALVIYGIVMTEILIPYLYFFDNDLFLLLVQTIVTTLIVLVTAEFLPKSIFRIFSNSILKIFSIPIFITFVLFRPLAIFLLKVATFLLKHILKQDVSQDKQVFGKTDLDDFLSKLKQTEEGEENRVEVEMLQNVLDLSEKKVRECMVPRTEIVAVDILSSIDELTNIFIDTKFSKILVFKGNIDNIIGYIHSSDLFKQPKTLRSVLLPLPFVPESMHAMDLLNQFIETNKGVAVVLDEFGGTSGMLTIEDVTEEIVGEIMDEHDIDDITEKKIAEKKYHFSARLDVEDINKKYNLYLPESEHYETLAGLILSHQEEIPKFNDIIVIDDFKFTITQVNDTAIQEVYLEIIDSD